MASNTNIWLEKRNFGCKRLVFVSNSRLGDSIRKYCVFFWINHFSKDEKSHFVPLLSDYCVARPCVDLVRLSTRNTTWVVVDIRASLMTILWGALNQSATKPFVISSLLGYGAVGVWHTRKSERFDEVVYKCKFCGNLSVWLMGLLNFVILWNPFKARHPSPSQNLRTHWPFKFGKFFITQENIYENTKFHVICKYSKLKM